MGKTHRYEIRRCRRTPGIELVTDQERLTEALLALYPLTLDRVGASHVYDFPEETLRRLANAEGALLLGVEVDAELAAITLFLHTARVGEYCISASSETGRKYTRLLIWTAIERLKDAGVTNLHLGGGVSPDDPLDHFKRRFGGQPVSGQAVRRILDPDKYSYLCSKYAASGDSAAEYFPPYWAGRSSSGENA
jgi:hypothetical protein